jgi:hypothetical protein
MVLSAHSDMVYALLLIITKYIICVCSGSYSWPTRRGNEVPEKFKNIVDACLQPHASNRPSIDSVLFMLEGAIQPPQHVTTTTTTSTPNLIDL